MSATTSAARPTAPPRENDSTTPSVIASVMSPAMTRSDVERSPIMRKRPNGTSMSITWAKRFVSPIGPAIRGWRTSPASVVAPVRIAESDCAKPR